MPFWVVPTILFYPAIAFLTVCPPSYGAWVANLFAAASLGSLTYAMSNLRRCLGPRLDFMTVMAILPSFVTIALILANGYLIVSGFVDVFAKS